jgi:hypothetical protein
VVFSPEEIQGFQRATQILTEMACAGHGWQTSSAKPHQLDWGLPEYLGVAFNLGDNEVTTEKLAWLQQRGWMAQVFNDRIILAPLVFVTPAAICYHTTLGENVSGILEKDLVTGGLAGRSTSKRKDCEGYIYVSFDLDSARKWASGHLLGKSHPGQEWGVIEIDSRALTGRVFRDPASSAGYMLEDKRVPKRFLSLTEKFRPDQ